MFRRMTPPQQLKGKVVLMRRNVLDLNHWRHPISHDTWDEITTKGITCRLISSAVADPDVRNGNRGLAGEEEHVEHRVLHLPAITHSDTTYDVTFDWDVNKNGVPGAVIVRNYHATEFLLKTITINDLPGHNGPIVFIANSWVYNTDKYHYERTYLPSEMPALLRPYREDELRILRGDEPRQKNDAYQEHDRVYRYDLYNDLGDPDKKVPRPTLGGHNSDFPYPRRCRTGRKPMRTDPTCESRNVLPVLQQFYVPRDECFNHVKKADFTAHLIKSISAGILPLLREQFDSASPREFDNFEDIYKLYEGGLMIPDIPSLDEMFKLFPPLRSIMPTGGDFLLKMPMPRVIKENKDAWRTDDEFAREMLAGLNPHIITRLKEFPPRSTLDGHGDKISKITVEHIQHNLGRLTVEKAIANNRLFILDHHDNFMPHLININKLRNTFVYATRTLLFLQDDDTLKPIAIELSKPRLNDIGTKLVGVDSKVYTPPTPGSKTGMYVEHTIWHLAKAYATVNDSAWHGLISHWLHTHAVIEPFVIATNRQLSVTHPIHKLLQPHYRDTMTINPIARQVLINANGFFEMTVCPGEHALRISSYVYKNWNFTEQALPVDLVKRGMAKPDPASPYGVSLLIKDYPYGVDGLAVWSAIESWVDEYCRIYYPSDDVLQCDVELQAWWKEVREVGHGDIEDQPWWPKMTTITELVRSCATIIWIASALHAAVNFGQYPYAGYLPNRPTVSRRPMPETGTMEYQEVETHPDMAFIHTITSQLLQSIIGVSLIEILSNHSSDEVYLGQRNEPKWTSDDKAINAFGKFRQKLIDIQGRIMDMNKDPWLKNRNGPAKFPYMLLYPNTSDADGESATGITAKGIPNSISI